MREAIVNLPEVAWAGLARLRRQQRQAPLDGTLCAHRPCRIGRCLHPRPTEPGDELVICPDFRIGDQIIRTISMVARFDNAVESTEAGQVHGSEKSRSDQERRRQTAETMTPGGSSIRLRRAVCGRG
jgi:hypothetical protein